MRVRRKRTTLTSVRGPAVRIRTSTPRLAAVASMSTKLRSGAKYGFVMYSVLRAPAIDSAKKPLGGRAPERRRRVEQSGASPSSAATRPSARPVNSTPVASTQAAANAAWSCRTAGPFEAHVRFAPRAVAAPVAEPLVVDAEPSSPSDAAIDDDAADVRAVLREVKRRESNRAETAPRRPPPPGMPSR